MTLDWTKDPLARGLHCYENQEFFEAHEHWEGIWLQSEEPEKTLLQALIQITAAFHHLQRGNPAGTLSLLRRSLRRLNGFGEVHAGVPVGTIRESVQIWIESLEQGREISGLSRPRMCG